mgnify:CR=1 FL=1
MRKVAILKQGPLNNAIKMIYLIQTIFTVVIFEIKEIKLYFK